MHGYHDSVIPDVVEPLYGYRAWTDQPRQLSLYSCYRDTPWPIDGPFEAKCINPHLGALRGGKFRAHRKSQVVPVKSCSCGIYALNELPTGKGTPWPLLAYKGVVEMWGKVVVGAKGYRAQFARPVALVVPRNKNKAALVEKIAERYTVRLLTNLAEWEEVNGHR